MSTNKPPEAKPYVDLDGNPQTLLGMIRSEPEWAATRIRQLEEREDHDLARNAQELEAELELEPGAVLQLPSVLDRVRCSYGYKSAACGYTGGLDDCDKTYDGPMGCTQHGIDEHARGAPKIHPERFGGFPSYEGTIAVDPSKTFAQEVDERRKVVLEPAVLDAIQEARKALAPATGETLARHLVSQLREGGHLEELRHHFDALVRLALWVWADPLEHLEPDIQDEFTKLGLAQTRPYNPGEHGEGLGAEYDREPGDDVVELAPWLKELKKADL